MNERLAEGARLVLRNYREGKSRASDVEANLESHLSAMEGIRDAYTDRARELAKELVVADLESEQSRAVDDPAVRAVLDKLERLLDVLANPALQADDHVGRFAPSGGRR